NFDMNSDLLASNFPFSTLNGSPANTLVFPNLESGNIAYKLLQEIAGADAVGPILLGMNKPMHILQLDSSERVIVNMVTIAVVDVQSREPQPGKQSNSRNKKYHEMYEYLNGKLVYKAPTHVVLDVGGVGYHVHISLNTYAQIKDNEQCKLFISFQV